MIQVASFEVVHFAFDSGGVVEIPVCRCKVTHACGKLVRVGIVRHNDTKTIGRIINGTSSFSCMLDGLDIFTGAGDQNVYMR